MTSSNLVHLYIDVLSVATGGNKTPESAFVPSATKFAESLVFSIGRRANRKRGSDVFVTPYWGHAVQRFMIGFMPLRVVEKFVIKSVTEVKERIEKDRKRGE